MSAPRRTRGGRDQFNWDDVKAAARKEATVRENYIGQSVMTEKSWIWSASAQPDADDVRRELEEIKRRDHEALQAQLGFRVPAPQGREASGVSRHEMQELLQRGALQRDEKDTAVKRSGLGRSNTSSFGGTTFAASEVLEGTAMPPPALPPLSAAPHATEADKKQKKKNKKKSKKEKKHKKHAKRSRSRSPEARKRHDSRSPDRRRRHDSPDAAPAARDGKDGSASPVARRRHDTPD